MQDRVGLRKVWLVINPELDRLARARYVSLTTFREDGAPVATPVWVVSEGGYLQVLSRAASDNVARLRVSERVLIAPCDSRGGLQGDPVDGVATIIDDPELVARVERLVRERYGLAARVRALVDKVRRSAPKVVLAITVAETAD